MINRPCIALSIFLACTIAKAEGVTEDHYVHASLEETTGFLSGIFIGGLAGGPPGAFIASGIGALLGENWSHQKNSKRILETALNDANIVISKKNNELKLFQKKYEIAQAEIHLLRNSTPSIVPVVQNVRSNLYCCGDIVTSIYFRSGKSNIESHYEEQLISMASLMKGTTNGRLEVTGFADRNGDGIENLDLSNLRINSVKSFFSERGINSSAIKTIAYGETRPLEINQTHESDFFDRRVVIRFLNNNQSSLTQLPNND